jgi:carboxyl-terminal processing protease
MKRRIWLTSVVLLLVFNAALLIRDRNLLASSPADDTGYPNAAVFSRALMLIRQDYVDDKKISYKDLTYAALRGMLSSLDPHSQFMDPQDFKGMQDDTRSEFGGLGVEVSIRDGYLTIIAPMEDTPGFKAGLASGDQILKIDGVSTEKMDLSDAIQKLRGEPGELVTLTVLRPSTKELKDYPIQRAIIKVDSVKDAKLLDSDASDGFKIGYARITQFNEPTAQDLAKKLDDLQARGMQAFVLDLRDNPGGLLNSAIDVCGQFVAPNTMVVYTDGRVASQRRVYRTAENSKQRLRFPMAILINGGSASGAEIVAGALKDLNRAILVGETTFGKGSVQSVVQLPDGSAVRLTTAKYYTPSRQVIHEKGVTPTIKAMVSSEQERQLLISRRGEMMSDADKKEVANFHDIQLDRAVDALKGVMVYTQRSAIEAKNSTSKDPAEAKVE